MQFLLDTHVLIWCLEDHKSLGPEVRQVIINPDHLVYVSTASLWEISIKKSLGKLKIPSTLLKTLENQFEILPITASHAIAFEKLPLLHKDPFDRMLVTQAKEEQLTLITHDQKVAQYDVPTLLT